MNSQLSQLLYSLGITANYTGYYYICYAVELVSNDPSRLIMVTKDLYPAIALHFSSTTSRVERNIRHVSALAWKTNPRLLQEIAGHRMQQRPSVSHLISILYQEYKKSLTARNRTGQQSLF